MCASAESRRDAGWKTTEQRDGGVKRRRVGYRVLERTEIFEEDRF